VFWLSVTKTTAPATGAGGDAGGEGGGAIFRFPFPMLES
jgi:hypothetical protein